MEYAAKDILDVMSFARNYNNFLVKKIVAALRGLNAAQILDFGAADGFFAEKIRDKTGCRLTCVEIDKAQLECCAQKGFQTAKTLDAVADSSVDLIYSLNVLEHIEDDAAVFADFYSKLKSGGVVFIYVPAFMALFSALDVKAQHVRRYSKKELLGKMRAAGFKIKTCEFADSTGIAATFWYKFFGNKNGELNKQAIIFYDRAVFPFSRFLDKILFKTFAGKNLLAVGVK